ncbi:MAG: lysostaphin resistance A-like protein [Candidatus Micrarchaeales archaeon]
MRKKSKSSMEESLRAFVILTLFIFFSFMLIKMEENLKITILNVLLSLLFLSSSLYYFRNSFQKLGLTRKKFKEGIFYGFVAFFFVLFFTILIEIILQLLGIQTSTNVEEIISMNVILLLSAVFISPICEEIFFRGVAIDFLEEKLKNKNLSIIISSLLFSIFHIGYSSGLEVFGAFVAGLIFAYFYKKSKTLFTPMFAHFLYNLLTISLIILNF